MDALAHPHGWYRKIHSRLCAHEEIYLIKGQGLDLFLNRDFLNEDECAHLIGLIDADSRPSTVMGALMPDVDYRTSHSSPLAHSRDPLITKIDERIAEFTGIPPRFGEPVEGQRYRSGQQFKPHIDGFLPDTPFLNQERANGGQRTWTVMLCLNDVTAGGATFFPHAGIRVKPKAGNAIFWSSVHDDGSINHASLHCGEPVIDGVKYIVTKWHRGHPFNARVRAGRVVSNRDRSVVRRIIVAPPPGEAAASS